MAAHFGNVAAIEDDDPISVADGAEPVGNHDRGAGAQDPMHGVLDRPFRFGVEAGRGLIKHQHIGIDQQGAGNAQPLPLPAGEPQPSLTDHGLVAVGELVEEFIDAGDRAGFVHLGQAGAGVAIAQVVEHSAVKHIDFLVDDRQPLPIGRHIQPPNI